MTIDYLKSIECGHVVTIVTGWEDKLEIGTFYFHNTFFLTFLLVAPTVMLVSFYMADDLHVVIILVGVTQIIFGVYLVQCLFNWRRLIKIEGIDMVTNKGLITPIINGAYPELQYEWDGDILIGSKPAGLFSFKYGVNIVAIFKESDIFLNILSIDRTGPNPWMALTNVRRAKEMGIIFRERTWHWRNETKKSTLDN